MTQAAMNKHHEQQQRCNRDVSSTKHLAKGVKREQQMPAGQGVIIPAAVSLTIPAIIRLNQSQ
jgi:glutamine amidotransferase PdxT